MQIFAASSYVARVRKKRQFRITGTQFDGYLPERLISVSGLFPCRKTSMHHAEFLHSCLIQTLESSYPQVNVGAHGIFHKDRNIRTFQCIGDFLYEERICSGAGPYPHHIHTGLDAVTDVLFTCHLGSHFHPEFLLHPAEPLQSGSACTFESVRMCARLPDTSPEHIYAQCPEAFSRLHHLRFRFRTARPGDQHRRLAFRKYVPLPYRYEFKSCPHQVP